MCISGGIFDVPGRQQKRSELEQLMAAGDFWDNREVADKTVAELSACKAVLEPFSKLSSQTEDFAALVELAEEDPDDASMLSEVDESWPDLAARSRTSAWDARPAGESWPSIRASPPK